MLNKMKKILPLFMISLLLLCAGCDKQDISNMENKGNNLPASSTENDSNVKNNKSISTSDQSNSNGQNNQSGQVTEMKIKVYYPDENGMNLVGVDRTIKLDDKNDKYTAAVKAVMIPPTEKKLTSVIPEKATLIEVKFMDGTAFVNLDKNIKDGFAGGSTGEEFLIGSIVNTLTEFEEVKEVQFLINGQAVETLSGHMDLTEPIARMNDLIK